MQKFEGINEQMLRQFAPRPGQRTLLPEMSEQAKVALMCRVLFKEGWNEHIAGHITHRLPNGNILANPWELAWDEVCARDILTLDGQGQVIEGDWNITPAIHLHIQLHDRRPDVQVVLHHHPHWSGLWASMGRAPPVYDQSSAYVAGELPVHDEYGDTFREADTSLAAIKALGDAKWALLANHGTLIVARDLRQAHLRAATLEWRCMRAWQVESAGGGAALSEEEIAKAGIADDNGMPFLFEAMARRELRADPTILD